MLVKACHVSNEAIGKVAKFLSLYEGPYKVKMKIARNTYILSNLKTDRKRGLFHAVDMKPYLTGDAAGVGISVGRGERRDDELSGKTLEKVKVKKGVSFLLENSGNNKRKGKVKIKEKKNAGNIDSNGT